MTINDFYDTHPLKKLKIEGKVWEYIACGNGKKTLLLLPGGAQTAQGNFRLIQAFESTHTLIIPTIYNVDTIDEFCHAINTILEKEKVHNILLYGLSLGGMMAISYTKRNKSRVKKLIISHACTPTTKSYTTRIKPLLNLFPLVSLIPRSFITFFAKNFAGKLQGETSENKDIFAKKNVVNQLTILFNQEFFEKYLTKRLITTWVRLHREYLKEKVTPADFSDWHGNVLILKSDNDPLVKDKGELAQLFPQSQTHIFHGTGHLTYYYAFSTMVNVMRKFLNKKTI